MHIPKPTSDYTTTSSASLNTIPTTQHKDTEYVLWQLPGKVLWKDIQSQLAAAEQKPNCTELSY